MNINIMDPAFNRLRGLGSDEILAERDRLAAEARTILDRSTDSSLSAEDDERFNQITRDLEFIGHVRETRQRLVSLASSGAVEHVTPSVPQQRRATGLSGQQTLTREQSVATWARDNGHVSRDLEHASFDKYLRGLVTGDWGDAPLERSLSEGTLSAGGYLVPTPLAGRVIDLARNAMWVMRAGAVTVPMTAQTLTIPRLTGEGSPAWRNEGAALTAGDLSFDTVKFTARSLDRLVIMSRELFEDSNPSAQDVIAHSFAAQIALELDRAALRGSGTAPEPRGVLNTSGVNITTHGANGSNITNYDWWLDAVATVRGNNFEPNAHIQAPRTSNSLAKLKDSQNRYLEPPDGMLPMLPTKQVPATLTVGTSTDCSEVYTADWSQLGIGLRTGFSLEFLRERYADNGQVAFIAHLRADIQLFQPGAFTIDTGVRS